MHYGFVIWSNPKRVASLAMLGLTVVGCATSQAAQETSVIKSLPGQPATVILAGSEYTLPPLMDMTMSPSKPGTTFFRYQDNATGCKGSALYESIGDAQAHLDFVKQREYEAMESGWSKQGIKFTRKEATVPLLGADARLATYLLIGPDGGNIGPLAVLDHHYDDQALSIVIEIDCNDEVLVQKEVERLQRLNASQKHL